MRIADIVNNKYLVDKCFMISFDNKIPRWFYGKINGNYAEWNLIKIPKRLRKDLHNRMSDLEITYGVKFPLDLYKYVISYWKPYLEFIDVDEDEEDYAINYIFFETLPGKELDVLISNMKSFYEIGGSRSYIPIGFDDVGDWLLLKSDDGTVWIEDTDFCEYRFIDKSLHDFLNRLSTT